MDNAMGRGLLAFVLSPVLCPAAQSPAAGLPDGPATHLETLRVQILSNDYQGAQLSITLYRKQVLLSLIESRVPVRNPQGSAESAGATGRDHLLALLDQVARMHSSGDLQSALNGATALWYALVEEHRRTRPSPAQRLERTERLIQSSTGTRHWMALSLAAKAALDAGNFEKARNYSGESLRLIDPSVHTWRQADAPYLAHFVAGRLALRSLDVDGTRRHLAAAAGESAAVLTYLAECAKYWKADDGKTAQWSEMIRPGKQPWAEWIRLHPPAR